MQPPAWIEPDRTLPRGIKLQICQQYIEDRKHDREQLDATIKLIQTTRTVQGQAMAMAVRTSKTMPFDTPPTPTPTPNIVHPPPPPRPQQTPETQSKHLIQILSSMDIPQATKDAITLVLHSTTQAQPPQPPQPPQYTQPHTPLISATTHHTPHAPLISATTFRTPTTEVEPIYEYDIFDDELFAAEDPYTTPPPTPSITPAEPIEHTPPHTNTNNTFANSPSQVQRSKKTRFVAEPVPPFPDVEDATVIQVPDDDDDNDNTTTAATTTTTHPVKLTKAQRQKVKRVSKK